MGHSPWGHGESDTTLLDERECDMEIYDPRPSAEHSVQHTVGAQFT